MFLSWYEKQADRKEHVLFHRRAIDADRQMTRLPHIHDSIELAFGIKDGSFVYINGVEYPIEAGCIYFINSFERHQYSYKAGSECYIVLISATFFDSVNNLRALKFPTVMRDGGSFRKIKDFLDYSYSVRNTDSLLFKTGFVNMLISLLTEYYPVTVDTERRKHSEVLVRAISYVNDNYKKKLTVEELARRFGYSKNYFSMLFNKYLGMNFREYLNRCRISEYLNLKMNDPSLPAYRAAELCGFENLSTFYRAYNIMKKDIQYIDHEF